MSSAIIPAIMAGSNIISGILGNKAQGQGLQLSREDLNRAYTNTNTNLTDLFSKAAPWLSWGYGQQQGATNNALANTSNMLNFGLNQGNQFRTSGLNNSLATINNMSSQMADRFNPYASSGNALAGLNKYIFGSPGPGSAIPGGGGNSLASVNPQRYSAPYVSPTVVNAPAMFTGSNSGSPSSGMPSLQSPSLSTPRLSGGERNTVSNAVTSAENASGGFGGNHLAAVAAGVAAGPLVGWLVNKWTSLGRNKVAASNGINAVSDYVKNDLFPAYQKGEIKPSEYQNLVNMALGDWANTLPSNVKQNSIEDQLWWFNNGEYKPEGVTFSIPGFSAVRHA
jgi:hypothetical protein